MLDPSPRASDAQPLTMATPSPLPLLLLLLLLLAPSLCCAAAAPRPPSCRLCPLSIIADFNAGAALAGVNAPHAWESATVSYAPRPMPPEVDRNSSLASIGSTAAPENGPYPGSASGIVPGTASRYSSVDLSLWSLAAWRKATASPPSPSVGRWQTQQRLPRRFLKPLSLLTSKFPTLSPSPVNCPSRRRHTRAAGQTGQ